MRRPALDPPSWTRAQRRVLAALALAGPVTGAIALAAFVLNDSFAWVAHGYVGTRPLAHGGTAGDAARSGAAALLISAWMALPCAAGAALGGRLVGRGGAPCLLVGIALSQALVTFGYLVSVGPWGSDREPLAGLAVTLYPGLQMLWLAGTIAVAWAIGALTSRWGRPAPSA